MFVLKSEIHSITEQSSSQSDEEEVKNKQGKDTQAKETTRVEAEEKSVKQSVNPSINGMICTWCRAVH